MYSLIWAIHFSDSNKRRLYKLDNENTHIIPNFVVNDINKAKESGMTLIGFGFEVNKRTTPFWEPEFSKTIDWLYDEYITDDEVENRENLVCFSWMNPSSVSVKPSEWIVIVNNDYYLTDYGSYNLTGVLKDCKLERNREDKAVRFNDKESAEGIAEQINGVSREVY
mgnify:CR=1 FL=1